MGYVSNINLNGVSSPITSSLCGTCSTAAATAAKVVTCSSFDALKSGVSIFVTFDNENTASNPTLNVNSTGAKAIKKGTSSEIKWEADTVVKFMYDGTYWQIISASSSSPTFTGEEIEVVATDQIKIGNIVYTIREGSPWTAALPIYVDFVTFSPDGSFLILAGGDPLNNYDIFVKIYSVNGINITYISDIYADAENTIFNNTICSMAFSPDGRTLIIGGRFNNCAKVYSVNKTNVTYISDVYADAGTTTLNNYVRSVAFSPDGNVLVLGGNFTGRAKIYSVNGTTITYVSDIYSDGGTTTFNDSVYSTVFSPNGRSLVISGYFNGKAKVYSVNGTTITYVSDIYADSGSTALSNIAFAVAFSPNGSLLVLGGSFTNRAKVYSVIGTTITYISDIYADGGTTVLSNSVYAASFSSDGLFLVLGGSFTGYAKVYSVNETIITYISNIYANSGTTSLSNDVKTLTLSPVGTTLVLGGSFKGYAKLYSINENTIEYVFDIYSNTGTTALDGVVNSAAFSPDGTKLVLSGSFTGRAKLYSVLGNTVTYLQDIYADTGTTVLSNIAYSAAFSPDGTKLVLGGYFTGKAKLYSILGNTVTYLQDIYSNTGTTALDGVVNSAAFSPDGSKLVLGGAFTGYAKLYSVSGTTVTYLPYGNQAHNASNGLNPNFDFIGYAKTSANSGENITIESLIGGAL